MEEMVSHQMENSYGVILNFNFATAIDFCPIYHGPSTDEYIELGPADWVSIRAKTDENYDEKSDLRFKLYTIHGNSC